MAIVKAESPELIGLISELKERIDELQNKVGPIKKFIDQFKEVADVNDDLVDYLQVKQQILMAYCVNVTFYLAMKVQYNGIPYLLHFLSEVSLSLLLMLYIFATLDV